MSDTCKTLSNRKLKSMLRSMIRIRDCENTILGMFQKGKMYGLGHMSVGEEACPVGTIAALRDTDYIMSNHRGHGHAVAKGVTAKEIVAELMGKATGPNHGLGGSLHIMNPSIRDMGANGIVGAGFGLAAGVAYACKYKGTDDICAVFFGDGASNTGMFHEIMNMSVIWQLPLLFICENNQYAISMPMQKSVCTPTISQRAAGYGIRGVTVDGNDVLAVYEAVKKGAESARNGVPYLIEMITYRWYGHSLRVSGGGYRSVEEEEAWKQKCPIKRFSTYLVEHNICTQEEIDEMHRDSDREMEEALATGSADPVLTYQEVKDLVFVQQ